MKNIMMLRHIGRVALTFMVLMFGQYATACELTQNGPTVDFGTIDSEYPVDAQGFVPITPMEEFDWDVVHCTDGDPNSSFILALRDPLRSRGTYSEGGKTYKVIDSGRDSLGFIVEYSALNSEEMLPFAGATHLIMLKAFPGLNRVRIRMQLGLYKRPTEPVLTASDRIFELRPQGYPVSIEARYQIRVKVTEKTCSVTQGSELSFDISPAHAGQFTGVGSTVEGKDFKLPLRCGPGIRLLATLTDASQPANRSATLSLESGSSARGVGYQILRNGNVPVAFGSDSAEVGTENQFAVVDIPTDGSDVDLPLKINYIQTDPVIVAGTANAVATITFAYQ